MRGSGRTRANERLLSRLAAEQWWGDRVLPSTASDTWLTDGLSRYAEAMYAEQSDGSAGLHKALEDFAVGALMYEDTAPISQAARLQTFSNEYRSVVADKGAMVFHMLRTELGDDEFTALLREFYKKYEGKNANLNDFEKIAMTKIPPPAKGQPPVNLVSFFSQWLNSTGVPEFKMEYIVYRTQKGFKVVGKIHQDLDTFRMPVQIRVDTEGNPEIKTILVTGTTQPFEIDTFGRPKPNGILIDPNNNLLKSSPRLRVHALIARGEGYAEAGQILRSHSGISKGAGRAAEQFAGAFPHGRGDVLPEELSGCSECVSRGAGWRRGSEMDGSLEPHLYWQDLRPAGAARARCE